VSWMPMTFGSSVQIALRSRFDYWNAVVDPTARHWPSGTWPANIVTAPLSASGVTASESLARRVKRPLWRGPRRPRGKPAGFAHPLRLPFGALCYLYARCHLVAENLARYPLIFTANARIERPAGCEFFGVATSVCKELKGEPPAPRRSVRTRSSPMSVLYGHFPTGKHPEARAFWVVVTLGPRQPLALAHILGVRDSARSRGRWWLSALFIS